MEIIAKKIEELITENYVYASVLYHFGIKFYDYSDQTLLQICEERGLDANKLIKNLEQVATRKDQALAWTNYPIDLILEYLRHTHFIFVKRKLPYMATLIDALESEHICEKYMVNDLKLLFPLFVDDFIQHIHEEEDTFFKYISLLLEANQKPNLMGKLLYEMEQNSIQKFALHHHNHDDEMRGIRELTHNYFLPSHSSLHFKVVYEELKALEKELKLHAQIEDEILFVKAMQLETEVLGKFKKFAQLN